MCDCSSTFRTDYNTDVCVSCGREVGVGLTIVQTRSPVDMSPFPNGYSKEKRFVKLLDGVLYPTPSAADNGMLEFLYGKTFESVSDLLAGMRRATLRDKRYISLHLFSRLFVKSYSPPPQPTRELRRELIREFEQVEFGHRRFCRNSAFFNYAWLLRRFLHEFSLHQHIRFVKQLRCRHRKRSYRQMLAVIRHSYSASEFAGDVSDSLRPLSGRLGGLHLRPAPTRTPSKMCGIQPPKCATGRMCANPVDSLRSYQRLRGLGRVGAADPTVSPRPTKPAWYRVPVCRDPVAGRLSGQLLRVSGPCRKFRPPPSESPSDSPP